MSINVYDAYAYEYICFMICICLRCIIVGNEDIHAYSYLNLYILVAHFLEAPLYKKGVNVSLVKFVLLKISFKKTQRYHFHQVP